MLWDANLPNQSGMVSSERNAERIGEANALGF
jgi:hypothetical protein